MNEQELELLRKYVTNTEHEVFAVKGNLSPELQAAVFGRYARSPKSARELLVTDFRDQLENPEHDERARDFNDRVFNEFGHESLAQLCTIHVGIEGVSQIVTKLIERSRLCSFMEQSSRAIDWSKDPRFVIPVEIEDSRLKDEYTAICNRSFSWYAEWTNKLPEIIYDNLRDEYPKATDKQVRHACKSAALDITRGALPLSIKSSLGMVGSAQSYAALIARLWTSPIVEAAQIGNQIYREVKKVAPTFMRHQQREIEYRAMRGNLAHQDVEVPLICENNILPRGPSVQLVDRDEDWFTKIVSSVLFEHGYGVKYGRQVAKGLTYSQASKIIEDYCGHREFRWQRPGRAFESINFEFEFETDYGIFRDLQRHRMLTCEWQRPMLELGFDHLNWARPIVGEAWEDLHVSWMTHMERQVLDIVEFGARLMDSERAPRPCTIDYIKPLATHIRYRIRCNARELMHILELRTQRGGHESYRRICQEMFRQVQDTMPLIARCMLVDENSYTLARIPKEVT